MLKDRKGFTLLEVMVVSIISLVMLTAVTSLMVTSVKTRVKSEAVRDAQVETQKAVFMITNGEKGGDRAGLKQALKVLRGTNSVALVAYDSTDSDDWTYNYYLNPTDKNLYFNRQAYPPLTVSTSGGEVILKNVASFDVYENGNSYTVELRRSLPNTTGITQTLNMSTEVAPRNTVLRENSLYINNNGNKPSLITNVKATPGSGQVIITWDPGTDGDLEGYNVYCRAASDSGNDFVKKNSTLINKNTTTFTVTSLTPGTMYYFAVDAQDTSGYKSFKSFTYAKPD